MRTCWVITWKKPDNVVQLEDKTFLVAISFEGKYTDVRTDYQTIIKGNFWYVFRVAMSNEKKIHSLDIK